MVSAPRKPDIATDRFNMICFCLPSRFRIVIILFVQVVLFLCLFHLLSPIRKSASHDDDVDDALSKAQQNRKVSGQGYGIYTLIMGPAVKKCPGSSAKGVWHFTDHFIAIGPQMYCA